MLHDPNAHNVTLRLIRVESPAQYILQQAHEMGVREPFSLLFEGPPDPFLPQRMYSLDHAQLGRFELFLVPVGQHGTNFRYEAIFG